MFNLNSGVYKAGSFPPPLGGGGIILSWWGRKSSGDERKGKRIEKGKGREGLIFFPREKGRLDFLPNAKERGIEKGGNA